MWPFNRKKNSAVTVDPNRSFEVQLMLSQEDSSVVRARKIFQAAGFPINSAVLATLPAAAAAIEAYQKFDDQDLDDMVAQVEELEAQIELLRLANEHIIREAGYGRVH